MTLAQCQALLAATRFSTELPGTFFRHLFDRAGLTHFYQRSRTDTRDKVEKVICHPWHNGIFLKVDLMLFHYIWYSLLRTV